MKNNNPQSVPGFRAGAVAAGIRRQDRLDLGLILADRPCSAAGIFTRNLVQAPSVVLDRERLARGRAQAVLVNSGNANACVGRQGLADAKRCTAAVARAAGIPPALALMNSTGVIGEPLPAGRIVDAVPGLVRAARPEGLGDFARAIMTTDTRAKLFFRRVKLGRTQVTLAGAAKGAGMIMPNLATMLVYLLTDAEAAPRTLRRMLGRAAADSFNALTIDGDTSTSDSVIIMASGASGMRIADTGPRARAFQHALDDLCLELAQAIAADGEGATRMFKVTVEGARTSADADRVARRVANSPLVKTAIHAADPNWGRILMAVGSAGVKIAPEKIRLEFETAAGRRVAVVRNGARAAGYSEATAAKVLAGTGFSLRIQLGLGKASRTIFTCDFSADYVKINAEYRT